MKKTCESTMSPNHSKDILEVWHGRPEPTYICGYHESRGGLAAVTAAKGKR